MVSSHPWVNQVQFHVVAPEKASVFWKSYLTVHWACEQRDVSLSLLDADGFWFCCDFVITSLPCTSGSIASNQCCTLLWMLSVLFVCVPPHTAVNNGLKTCVPWCQCYGVGIDKTHAHTRLTTPCPGLPGWAGTRKVKPIWILLKQETVSGSGISWAVCKSAPRSRQITTPAPHYSVFFTGRMPFLLPNAHTHLNVVCLKHLLMS